MEHDLVRIIGLLSGRDDRPRPRGPLRRRRPRLRIHPVIVLDEIDKLTDNDDEAIADLRETARLAQERPHRPRAPTSSWSPAPTCTTGPHGRGPRQRPLRERLRLRGCTCPCLAGGTGAPWSRS
ncbi:hypothetical protein LT493_33840 [Streptomyces tricolor]|nr:hypothetical protein [Streptomyces tricolor]